MKGRSISLRLIIGILAIIVPMIVIMLVYEQKVVERLLLESAKQKTVLITNRIITTVDLEFNALENIPESLAPTFPNLTFQKIEFDSFIKKYLEKNPHIIGMAIAFLPYQYNSHKKFYSPYCHKLRGSTECKDLALNNYNYSIQEWFKKPLEMKKSIWSSPYYDQGGADTTIMTYSAPFYNAKNVLAGVITLDISLEWLSELLTSVQIYKSGYAFITNQDSLIIAHPIKEYRLKQSLLSIGKDKNAPHLINISKAIANKETGFKQVESIVVNQKAWIYYTPLQVNNWSICLVFPQNELFEDLAFIKKIFLTIGAIAIFAIVLVIIIISKKITSPLKKFSQIAYKISHGDLNQEIPNSPRSASEIQDLAQSFAAMQKDLKDHIDTMIKMSREKERVEQEVFIAKEIQEGMLPKNFNLSAALTSNELYGTVLPAKEVGGDLFDCFLLSPTKLCLAIGDVSGKGVPASLYMAITISLLRALKTESPQEMMELINKELCRDNANMMFVTMFIATIDLKTGELKYTNAGHNFPYVIHSDKSIEQVQITHGPPLGVWNGSYDTSKIQLKSGDRFFLYTDGIVEAHLENSNELFGENRLEHILHTSSAQTSKDLALEVIEKVNSFQGHSAQYDDMTIQAFHFIKESERLSIKTAISENALELCLSGIANFVTHKRLSESLSNKITLVSEEILTNIINNQTTNKAQTIEIEASIDENKNEISLSFADDGIPFDPLTKAPPDLNLPIESRPIGGLGIFLIKELSTHLVYKYSENKNRLLTVLDFKSSITGKND